MFKIKKKPWFTKGSLGEPRSYGGLGGKSYGRSYAGVLVRSLVRGLGEGGVFESGFLRRQDFKTNADLTSLGEGLMRGLMEVLWGLKEGHQPQLSPGWHTQVADLVGVLV